MMIYMYPSVNSNSVTDIFSFHFSFLSVFRTCCFCLMSCDYFILCVCVCVTVSGIGSAAVFESVTVHNMSACLCLIITSRPEFLFRE